MSRAKKDEPKLPTVDIRGKPFKLLPKYNLTPQLPKNDPLLKYIKETAKHDRRK
jgi:hypothetical protein